MFSSSRDIQHLTFGEPCGKEDSAQSKYRTNNARANKKGKVKFSGQNKYEQKFIWRRKGTGLGTKEKNQFFS